MNVSPSANCLYSHRDIEHSQELECDEFVLLEAVLEVPQQQVL